MKEIGSEFWSIPLSSKKNQVAFPRNVVWYLSGRSALNAILDDICKHKRIKTAALPSWCCDSMIKPFISHGIEVSFYPIYLDDEHRLKQDVRDFGCDAILALDYFGFHNCPDFKTNAIVIRDITHSVFCNTNYEADYVFGSLRKWTGFYTGGFAWSSDTRLSELPLVDATLKYYLLRDKAMSMKNDYIKNTIGDKSFLSLFSKAEEWLDNNSVIYGSSERDIVAFNSLDAAFICDRRRQNAEYLLIRLSKYSFVDELSKDDCPLFVPIFLNNEKRNRLRQFLIENDIYCPVHWGVSELHRLNSKTREIYDMELSIICDQRYDLSDMERIADTIESFLE